MKIEFIGAAHEVTGSCHFVSFGDINLLVDCGMEQGADIYENQEIPINAGSIDYVFITHAHIDHSGLLPLLYKHGFSGQIYATNATTQLCNIMLLDSAHIQEFEAEWKNRKARRAGREEVVPMYTTEDAQGVLTHFIPCDYGKVIDVSENLKVCFRDAGHLLGSSFIEMWITEDGVEKKIIFSGDLGNGNRALIKDPEVPLEADYLLIESTYGNRNHEVPPDYAVEMAKVLQRTFSKGGNLVIPAFSVGRTQEMLYHLHRIKFEHLLPEFENFEVYVDSPLAVEATNIFNRNVQECFKDEARELILKGENPIGFPGLKTAVSSEDSKMINFLKNPMVIISASGMCEAGRIRHHLKHNLWRPECAVLFVGYQVPGTLGYNLLNGAETVKLFGESIDVKAEIINLPGISGHADENHLTAWVQNFKKMPDRIFVVHGEDSVTDAFAEHLHEVTGVCAVAPYSGDIYDLKENALLMSGARKRAEKKTLSGQKAKAAKSAFERLLAAAKRLLKVAENCQGMANKDLLKFTTQIENLINKWER